MENLLLPSSSLRERERERERESPTKNEKNLLSAQKNPPFRSASSPTNIRRKF
jgi:hypothetical protein